MDPTLDEKKEISWTAPEFRYVHKDVGWYWLTLIAAGIIFLIALWQRNLLFAMFIVIAEAMTIMWAKEFPKNIEFKLNRKGLQIGKIKFYGYEELSGFHILESHDRTELILKTKTKLHPYLKILLEDAEIPEIKELLKKYLPEIEYEESLTDAISKMIGF
ncbi:MAG: hypothetical protein HZB99_04680 [Candidatus Harrisonbacteria bacterium]|nr:hypothetical protein [Candidatus Harrisonbacteria bacterium]